MLVIEVFLLVVASVCENSLEDNGAIKLRISNILANFAAYCMLAAKCLVFGLYINKVYKEQK